MIDGRTAIGAGTRIFPFASIGLEPQDLKYGGEESSLVIGRRNTIREYVTMNPGTAGGGMVTRIGDYCLFMVGAHVAHDCRIADHVDHGQQRDAWPAMSWSRTTRFLGGSAQSTSLSVSAGTR